MTIIITGLIIALLTILQKMLIELTTFFFKFLRPHFYKWGFLVLSSVGVESPTEAQCVFYFVKTRDVQLQLNELTKVP
jgi:hypothetical protein